ncbi:ABC transporter substrate-binding protein [Microbacterium betulae]|uniref:ABC transporter substrate-binding protein n=1 Tax=Microbacterium betulae TaxID=2981139 RepID=A0AA97FJK3_9MICO|nr:ABC transporter substrate-binding protein [Microbacterium sp. AB]WOF23229.1 ABC transporter substrate-binding protein [Microbacterium sp. AB]
MKLSKPFALTGALAALALVAGCAPADASAEGDAITVGTLRGQPHLFSPYFYDEVAEDGLSFEIVLFDSSSDIKNAIVSGSIDFGVTGSASVVSGVAEEQDVRIVASAADGGTRIVASPDIGSVEDLVGTKVGFPLGSTQEILLKRTLEAQGVDPLSDVELVNLPFADMASAYESGQVDAFISAEIGPSIAIGGGAHELLSAYDTEIGRTNIVLATSNSLIASDPDLVQDVVDTHVAAVEHMSDDVDAWAEGLVDEFGLDETVTRTAIENTWPRWQLDDDYLATLEAMSAEMLAFDQVAAEVDPSLLVDTSFVEASAAS